MLSSNPIIPRQRVPDFSRDLGRFRRLNMTDPDWVVTGGAIIDTAMSHESDEDSITLAASDGDLIFARPLRDALRGLVDFSRPVILDLLMEIVTPPPFDNSTRILMGFAEEVDQAGGTFQGAGVRGRTPINSLTVTAETDFGVSESAKSVVLDKVYAKIGLRDVLGQQGFVEVTGLNAAGVLLLGSNRNDSVVLNVATLFFYVVFRRSGATTIDQMGIKVASRVMPQTTSGYQIVGN